MNFKLKGETKKEIELWLEDNGEGCVSLKSRQETGTVVLMKFRDGRFYRCNHAQMNGLATDGGGRIKEEEDASEEAMPY